MWVITGASGFVGGHILRTFVEAGDQARGLLRREVPVWNVAALQTALDGARGVIHAASVVHRPSTPASEYVGFNIGGTRALLAAARASQVRQFIFISSIKVNGEAPAGTIDEATPVVGDAEYARTKAEAEKLVLEATDLNPVVLRLCPVYGRGDKGNVRRMIRAIWRRRFLVPGDGSTRKSIVHVSTVAQVVRAAATTPSARGVFVVADRVTPSIRELADSIASALGRRRPLSIPTPLLQGAAAVVGAVARYAGSSTNVSELIRKAQTSSVCNPSRAIRELNVSCHANLGSSLRDEVDWLRAERLL
jgi:UDP-glucose 4-epimerase